MAATLGGQGGDGKGSPLGAVVLVGSLFALLAGTIAFAWHTWRMMDVEVGTGGLVIAGIGSTFGIVAGRGADAALLHQQPARLRRRGGEGLTRYCRTLPLS